MSPIFGMNIKKNLWVATNQMKIETKIELDFQDAGLYLRKEVEAIATSLRVHPRRLTNKTWSHDGLRFGSDDFPDFQGARILR